MVDQSCFCTECGAAVSSTDKFCADCGHNLGDGVPAPSTTPPLTPRLPPPRGVPKSAKILLVAFALLVGSCNVAVWVNAPRFPESAGELGCETARLWTRGSENACASYRKPAGLSGEVWTPQMVDAMRTEFIPSCKEDMLGIPAVLSLMERSSLTPLTICECASEVAQNQWTPAELVEQLEERPNTLAYEMAQAMKACIPEAAD